ncbi:hypothetical protein EDD86DRAFT_190305 [Gorgonomyces haynaldii]|nr:hypothetical protein EDD86DRAFT_190305 [Gorgonomyces haynaldii]
MDASRELDEFLSQLETHLTHLLTNVEDEDQLMTWMQQTKSLWGQNAHNYLICYSLVYELSKTNHALVHVLELMELGKDAKMLSEAVIYSEQAIAEIVHSLVNIQLTPKPSLGDVIRLYKHYQSSTDVGYLQNARIFNPLIADVFSDSRSHQEEKLWLLAFASTTKDRLDPQLIQSTIDGLKSLDLQLQRVVSMAQLKDQLLNFLTLVQDPLLSMATLHWLKEKFYDENFYDWNSLTLGQTPAGFHLLDEIAHIHPLQRPVVFEIWKSLFEREFGVAPVLVIQFRDLFLNHFIVLLQTGYVMPVLDYLATHERVDVLLYVSFLQKLVPKIEMPCDLHVYRQLVTMISHIPQDVRRQNPSVMSLLGIVFDCSCCRDCGWYYR